MSYYWPPALTTSSGPAPFLNIATQAKAPLSSFGELPKPRPGRVVSSIVLDAAAVACVDEEVFGLPCGLLKLPHERNQVLFLLRR